MVKNVSIALLATILGWSCASAANVPPKPDNPDVKRHVVEGVSYDVLVKRVELQEGARNLLLIREPGSGLTWWFSLSVEEQPYFAPAFPESLLGAPTNVGVSRDRIAVFTVHAAPPRLDVSEFRSRFATFAEAERVLSSPRMMEREGHRFTMVDLRGHLGNDFRIPLGGGHVPRPITIPRVRRTQNDQWLVTLRGPNGDFADVTLTDEYELVDVRRYR